MIRYRKPIVILVFALLAFAAEANTVERKTEPFNGLSIRIDGTVYVEQGEKQKIEITAQAETLNRMITEVDDSILVIRYNRSFGSSGSFNPGPVGIRIVMTKIKSLSLASGGMLFCEKTIEGNAMKLNVSGSGDMNITTLKTGSLKVSISGSGNIKLAESGKVTDTSVSITGSGFFIAEGLSTDYADIRIAGSGDCSLTVNQALKASILGSGDIRYRGHPQQVDSRVAGSGSVRKIE